MTDLKLQKNVFNTSTLYIIVDVTFRNDGILGHYKIGYISLNINWICGLSDSRKGGECIAEPY